MSMFNGTLFAAPPPDGVTPNINAPYEATSLVVISCIFLPLAFLSICIRVYTRAAVVGKMSMDDYLMVAAMACSIVVSSMVFNMLNYGLGKHLWDVPIAPDLFPNFSIPNLVAAIVFCAATGLAKGSILLFYLRIFPSKSMVYTVWILFAFTEGYSLASVFVNIFSCNPIRASWDLEFVATAVCINRPAFYFAQAGLGIFTDIATVVAPLPYLKTLQLPTKQKIGVGVVLTMGALNTVPALMWCVLELNLSIIGGSIPTLKPFLQRLFPRLLGSTGASGARRTGPYVVGGSASRGQRSGQRPAPSATFNKMHSSSSGSRSRRDELDAETASEEYIMNDVQNITKTVEYGFEFNGHAMPGEGKNIQPRGL